MFLLLTAFQSRKPVLVNTDHIRRIDEFQEAFARITFQNEEVLDTTSGFPALCETILRSNAVPEYVTGTNEFISPPLPIDNINNWGNIPKLKYGKPEIITLTENRVAFYLSFDNFGSDAHIDTIMNVVKQYNILKCELLKEYLTGTSIGAKKWFHYFLGDNIKCNVYENTDVRVPIGDEVNTTGVERVYMILATIA